MSDSFAGFDARRRRIETKHGKLANGYDLHMQKDGLIVARPRRTRGLGVTPRVLILVVAALLGFKGFLIAALGPMAYSDRVERLGAGSAFEKAGAWVMQADPVSREIGAALAPYLK
ncbi:hypothetical protein [Marinibacterium profundimaris]|uniref:Uncharacterized protein n=1 Tax=Marinibacterium profundimaris TaxID=1679460 RepID=A0A225NGK0_9RHOB|nr:hypothetical protein [Marinibacterium profundimaris]OWU72473.1 hypothetical protein ATO3_15400 [Marinibacterium profundimaris]